MLLCGESFARRHGADWAPLADASLHRGYDVRASTRQRSGGVPQWLSTVLAAAAGAGTATPAARRPEPVHATTRLAAQG
ncbi:hypothetical protein ABZ733_22065 [Streptomyces longwoodensis]|uniref:hypothetical protein n=1 Tax=Streptomyces longwoodensis TaxID=68231 RepID=UPI0033F40150